MSLSSPKTKQSTRALTLISDVTLMEADGLDISGLTALSWEDKRGLE